MSLVTGFDRSPAMGAIHRRTTSQYRPITRSPTQWACRCARRICANTGPAGRSGDQRQRRRKRVAWHPGDDVLASTTHPLSSEQTAAAQATPARSCGSPRRRSAAMPPSAAILTSPSARSRRAVRLPTVIAHRMFCRGGIGEYRSPVFGRGALFGSVRQAGAAAGHRGTTSPKAWRLGSHATV